MKKAVQVKHEKVIKVKTVSLDSLLNKEKIENLKLIKIDAEGAELQILKGGKNLIQKYKPYVTLEIHPNSFANTEMAMSDIYETITGYSYKIMISERELLLKDFLSFNTFFEVLLIPIGR